MTRPGDRIHRLANRLLDEATVARLVEPAIADMQWELEAARSAGHAGQRRALIRGYASLLRLFPFLLVLGGYHYCGRFLREDNDALRRVIAATAAAVVALTMLLILPLYPSIRTLTGAADSMLALLLSTPQALGVALPTGFLVGTLIGLRGRAVHRRTTRRLFACGAAIAVVILLLLEWGVPRANHHFRDLIITRLTSAGIAPGDVHLEDGPGEMPLSELRRRIDVVTPDPVSSRGRETVRFAFHVRLALLASPLALAVMGLGVTAWGRGRWWTVVVGIALLAAVIQLVWFDGGVERWSPVFRVSLARAWTPDAVFAAVGLGLLWRSRRSGSETTARTCAP